MTLRSVLKVIVTRFCVTTIEKKKLCMCPIWIESERNGSSLERFVTFVTPKRDEQQKKNQFTQ